MCGQHRDVPLRSPHKKDLLPGLQGVWPSDSLQLTASGSASSTESDLPQGHALPRAPLHLATEQSKRFKDPTWNSSDGLLILVPECFAVLANTLADWHQFGFSPCPILFPPPSFHRCSPLITSCTPKSILAPAFTEPNLRPHSSYVLLVYFSNSLMDCMILEDRECLI